MRVVVAMSGGVDSSVAAALLARDGHDVVGLSMQLYDQSNGAITFGSCCTLDALYEARRLGLRVASKKDSQEICFVPPGEHPEFVARRAALPGGVIRDREGRELGRHDGIHRFTIGQRKGLGLSAAIPLYVVGIDAEH